MDTYTPPQATLMTPQPFEGADKYDILPGKQAVRFYRYVIIHRTGSRIREKQDIPVPPEFQDSRLELAPWIIDDQWCWTATVEPRRS